MVSLFTAIIVSIICIFGGFIIGYGTGTKEAVNGTTAGNLFVVEDPDDAAHIFLQLEDTPDKLGDIVLLKVVKRKPRK